MNTDNTHPLQAVVLRAFTRERPAHDASSIGYHLAGAIVPGEGARAYHTVAHDVLGFLEKTGHLYRDQLGWHRRHRAQRTR
jgi:hypothetical protein